MKNQTFATGGIEPIWERVIELEKDLSPTAAGALLKVRFSPRDRDRDRMNDLVAKARAGTLTSQEELQIDTFE